MRNCLCKTDTRPENVRELLKKPAAVDESAWIYEHLRFGRNSTSSFDTVKRQVVLQLNLLVCKLANICDVETCPQMIATEDWTYLCAAHPEPKEVQYTAQQYLALTVSKVLCH